MPKVTPGSTSTYTSQAVGDVLRTNNNAAISQYITMLNSEVERNAPNNFRMQLIGSMLRKQFDARKQQQELQKLFQQQQAQLSTKQQLLDRLDSLRQANPIAPATTNAPALTAEQQSVLQQIQLLQAKISHIDTQLAQLNQQMSQQVNQQAAVTRIQHNINTVQQMRQGKTMQHQITPAQLDQTIKKLLQVNNAKDELGLVAQVLQEKGHTIKASETVSLQKTLKLIKQDNLELEAEGLDYETAKFNFDDLLSQSEKLLQQRQILVNDLDEQLNSSVYNSLLNAFAMKPEPGKQGKTVEEDEMIRFSQGQKVF